jgi:hypothetical protein
MSKCRCVLWCVALLLVGVARADTLVQLDGTTRSGSVVAIDSKNVTWMDAASSKASPVPLADVSEVQFPQPALLSSSVPNAVLKTVEGSSLAVDSWTLAKGVVALKSESLGERTVSLESLSMVLFPGEPGADALLEQCRELGYEPGSKDRLITEDAKSKWRSAEGVLVGTEPEKIVFQFKGKDRTVKESMVRAIFLAQLAGAQKVASPKGWAHLANGSVVGFSSMTIAKGQATLATATMGSVSVVAKQIRRVVWASDRMAELSAMTPSAVTQQGFFGKKWAVGVNRSVAGGALRLDGKQYLSGVGLHSRCELTYALAGKYTLFVARAGIDGAVQPAGEATLTILGDGKPLLKSTVLRGKDVSVPIRLDVKGVKTLTIRVGYGADKIDTGDHVDLVAARLIR